MIGRKIEGIVEESELFTYCSSFASDQHSSTDLRIRFKGDPNYHNFDKAPPVRINRGEKVIIEEVLSNVGFRSGYNIKIFDANGGIACVYRSRTIR